MLALANYLQLYKMPSSVTLKLKNELNEKFLSSNEKKFKQMLPTMHHLPHLYLTILVISLCSIMYSACHMQAIGSVIIVRTNGDITGYLIAVSAVLCSLCW